MAKVEKDGKTRYMLRLDPDLRARLERDAAASGVSLSDHIVGLLVETPNGAAQATNATPRAAPRRPGRERTQMCPHRVPAGSYCSRGCD